MWRDVPLSSLHLVIGYKKNPLSSTRSLLKQNPHWFYLHGIFYTPFLIWHFYKYFDNNYLFIVMLSNDFTVSHLVIIRSTYRGESHFHKTLHIFINGNKTKILLRLVSRQHFERPLCARIIMVRPNVMKIVQQAKIRWTFTQWNSPCFEPLWTQSVEWVVPNLWLGQLCKNSCWLFLLICNNLKVNVRSWSIAKKRSHAPSSFSSHPGCRTACCMWTDKLTLRLAPVLQTIFHQCVTLYTCSQSYSDGSVLKQSHQSKTGYKYIIWHIDKKLF